MANIRVVYRYSIFLWMALVPFSFFAQEKSSIINLSGIIRDDKDRPLPFVKVIVKSGKQKDVTNMMGMFSLAVNNTDTIYIYSEGFEKLRLVIRDTVRMHQICVDIKMTPDTLAEPVAVFPYKTYEEFKDAVLKLQLKEDYDIENARRNIALIKAQILLDNTANPNVNFRSVMQEQYERTYVKGQFMSNPLLNVFNWAKFIEALKRGDFKNSRDLRGTNDQ
jgi:hypothetical protein